jgi:predicted GNAT family N-acyltransferase
MALKISLLDSRQHIRAGFCCGETSLDTYLHQQASQDLKRRVSTIFVLTAQPEMIVLGYYTLSSYTIQTTALEQKLAQRLPPYPALPATLLGRLAVDRRHSGNGWGELLLIDALKRSLGASQQVASLAVIVDALNERVVNFYQKYGFIVFRQEPLKLYLPMKSIEKLLLTLDIL